jgi:protein-L-isoaspartate O-methyltransferase
MLRRLLAGRPAAPTEALERLNPAVPKSLAQVVAFTMAPAPAERYANAAAVMEALAPYVPQQPAAAVVPSREAAAYETWLRSAGVLVESAPAAIPTAQPAIPTAKPAIPTAQAAIATAQPAIPVAQPLASAGVAVAAPAMAVPELAAISAAAGGSSIARQRRAKGKRGKSKLFFGLAAVGALLALAIGGYAFRTELLALFDAPTPAPDATANAGAATGTGNPRQPPANTVAANVKPAIPPDAEIITALGEDVWQSPTKGKPLELNYLPAGVQIFVALRPADLLAHEEGPRVLAALGPFGEFVQSQLQALSGTAPENIEQAVFGLLPAQRDEDPPLVALVVRAKEAVPEESLLSAWNNPSEETVAGQRVFQNTTATYYIPAEGGGKLWASAPFSSVGDIEAWLAAAKKQQPLRKEMEALQRSSDAQRHLTVLFATNALKPGLFAGPTARARTPLLDFLSASESGEQPPAALFSLHLKGDDFFAEARLYAPATVQPLELAMRYQDAVNGLQTRYLEYISPLVPHEYGRRFLEVNFVQMVGAFAQHIRVGVDDKQAVLRCYLPSIAAHNLALGTQLAVLETGGGSGAGAAPAVVVTTKTAAEKLQERTTYVAPRGPFDAFAEAIGDELGFRVVLVGEDFELAGITKNQQFDMNEQDKTYAEILKAALLKANPAGLLVFVIRKEDDQEAIFVTTRKGAETRKETIHEVFAAP